MITRIIQQERGTTTKSGIVYLFVLETGNITQMYNK